VNGRPTCAALALVGLTGCAAYSGGARSVDPATLTSGPGWVSAAPTPVLRQEGEYDCGAASLAMVAGRWHLPLSVDAAHAALPESTPQGTRLGDLRDAARAHGLAAFAIAGDRDTVVYELRAGRPVILGLLLPYGPNEVKSHYEVVVGAHLEDGLFLTIDPASGAKVRSWAALDAEWHPAGRPALVVLGPSQLIASRPRSEGRASPEHQGPQRE